MHRLPREGWFAGVCAGLAEHWRWSATGVRALFVMAAFMTGFFPAIVGYVVLSFLMVREDQGGDRDPRFTPSRSRVRARYSRLDRRLAKLESYLVSSRFEWDQRFRQGGGHEPTSS